MRRGVFVFPNPVALLQTTTVDWEPYKKQHESITASRNGIKQEGENCAGSLA
jgi:hypothetical protein